MLNVFCDSEGLLEVLNISDLILKESILTIPSAVFVLSLRMSGIPKKKYFL